MVLEELRVPYVMDVTPLRAYLKDGEKKKQRMVPVIQLIDEEGTVLDCFFSFSRASPRHDTWDCQSGLPIRPGVVLGVNVGIYGIHGVSGYHMSLNE